MSYNVGLVFHGAILDDGDKIRLSASDRALIQPYLDDYIGQYQFQTVSDNGANVIVFGYGLGSLEPSAGPLPNYHAMVANLAVQFTSDVSRFPQPVKDFIYNLRLDVVQAWVMS